MVGTRAAAHTVAAATGVVVALEASPHGFAIHGDTKHSTSLPSHGSCQLPQCIGQGGKSQARAGSRATVRRRARRELAVVGRVPHQRRTTEAGQRVRCALWATQGIAFAAIVLAADMARRTRERAAWRLKGALDRRQAGRALVIVVVASHVEPWTRRELALELRIANQGHAAVTELQVLRATWAGKELTIVGRVATDVAPVPAQLDVIWACNLGAAHVVTSAATRRRARTPKMLPPPPRLSLHLVLLALFLQRKNRHPRAIPLQPRQQLLSLCTNFLVPAQVNMSQRFAASQHPRQCPCSLCTDLIQAQVKMSQRPASPQRPRQCPRSRIINLVHAQVKMSKHLARPQRPRQPTRSVTANLVFAQVKMCQRHASCQRPSQWPSPDCTNLVSFQVKMSQPLTLPEHPRQPTCSLCTNHVPPQAEMRQHLAPPQRPG
eukprot:2898697-Rhodomonas_salina.3